MEIKETVSNVCHLLVYLLNFYNKMFMVGENT